MTNQPPPANCPQKVIEVAEIIGMKNALLLVDAVGGEPAYIPKKPTEKCKLAAVIGLDALRKLAGVYAGDWLTLPIYAARKSKKAAIREGLLKGKSYRKIREEVQTSIRYIALVKAEMDMDDAQMRLFE